MSAHCMTRALREGLEKVTVLMQTSIDEVRGSLAQVPSDPHLGF